MNKIYYIFNSKFTPGQGIFEMLKKTDRLTFFKRINDEYVVAVKNKKVGKIIIKCPRLRAELLRR